MPAAWQAPIAALALAACIGALLVQRTRAQRLAARTERLAADLELVRTAFVAQQHLAAVGSLAAPFAHGANNRLTVILSCLDIIAAAGLPDADSSQAATLATGAAQQLAADMASLLAGARRLLPEPEVIGLRERLAQVSGLYGRIAGPAAPPITLDVPPDLALMADPNLFDAAMLRICLFALRTGATQVHVAASVTDIEAHTPARPMLRKGTYGRLEVALPGARLSEALVCATSEPGHVFDRLLDPDGLELAAVESFVTSQRGQLTAIDRGREGAMLEMFLPVTLDFAVGAMRQTGVQDRSVVR